MKTILVTGANRGIGLEICRQLAERRFTVILTARDAEKARRAAESISGEVIPHSLDVCEATDVAQLAAFTEQKFGRLDVLINNAGIGVGSKGAVDANLAEVRQIFETNFFGAWQVSLALLPLLHKSEEGRIINISSGMGALSDLTGGYAGYRLSKSALNALTILMANELRGSNVKVNAVCPGWVRTDMGGPGAPRSVEQGAETPVWLATLPTPVPTGKFFQDKQVIPW